VVAAGLPYPITVAQRALEDIPRVVRQLTPDNRVVVICDPTVMKLYGQGVGGGLANAGVTHDVLSFAIEERTKTRETWAEITDVLMSRRYGRDTTLVALGGGVVGDLVGFVAATYMRGVPVLQVPTTLLAMVDASIGGKTGVDTPQGKNLVGAFHPPIAVVVDPLVLSTLHPDHLRAGFAEIVKHGVVADSDYFDRVGAYVERWPLNGRLAFDQLTSLIQRSIEIKAGIVTRDERESGLRKVLNFGHTIGHAIEAASEFRMLHGEAVAIGLVAEARLAEQLGVANDGTARNIEAVCRTAGLPTVVPSIPVDRLLEFTRSDKKVRAGRVEYALPKRIGEMAGGDRGWAIAVDDAAVREALGA
jgi:3-dehydroquinate synthase